MYKGKSKTIRDKKAKLWVKQGFKVSTGQNGLIYYVILTGCIDNEVF